ncbi:MAG TPA: hypothetical protein VHC46_06760, partial [Thermodesulfobacteriota bacterium]|nr:hypothetical protein [Thermodesulfobacteriota bacterium]
MRSKVLQPIAIFLLILAFLSAIIILIIQTQYFRQFVKVTTNAIVSTLIAQNFTIGSIEGNFLKGITLRNVSLGIDGSKFIDCDEIYIDYSLPLILDGSMLFSRVVPLNKVRITGLRINLVHHKDDTWNFQIIQKLMMKGQKKPNPDWNFFVEDGSIRDAVMTIHDESRNERSIFELPNADLSMNLFKIADKAEFDVRDARLIVAYQSMDFEKLYFENIRGKAVYSNKTLPDRLEVEDVVFNYMGATVSGKGAIDNMMDPRFSLGGEISDVEMPKVGKFNVEIEGRGSSAKWKDLHASGKMKLKNSSLLESPLGGGIESVVVDNTHIELKNGSLNAPFGEASFDGAIDLREMKDRGKDNTAVIDIDAKSLKAPAIIEFVEKMNGPIEAGFNRKLDAVINSRLKVAYGWSRHRDFSLGVDIGDLTLTGGGAGEIKLKGPLSLSGSRLEYELSAEFLKTNFAPILDDERYATDFNSA